VALETHTADRDARVDAEQCLSMHRGPMDDVVLPLKVPHAILTDHLVAAVRLTGKLALLRFQI